MSKPDIWRLILKDKNYFYKICNFWGWDKDATLNIKIYSNDSNKLHKILKVDRTETPNPDGTIRVSEKVSFNDVIPTDFSVNKHTFHPSGFIHTTNFEGKKYELGIRSIPFEKIETFRQLAVILPKKPSTYPTISEKNLGKNDVVLNIKQFLSNPFQIDVYVVRGDKKPPIEKNISLVADVVCGESETYRLFVRCKQPIDASGKPFPPYTFIGKFIQT